MGTKEDIIRGKHDMGSSSTRGSLLMLYMPYQGHINPTLGTVRALVKASYSVTYVCDPRWRDQIEDSGALFVPYDDYPEQSNKVQSLRGGIYAIETARRLAAEKQYDALMYEGLLLSGKCLADQNGVPSIRLSSTFAYNRSILAKLSDTGGLHVTSLLKFPAVVKLMSLSMRRHGRIESDDFVTEMVDNNPTPTYVYTSRSFQLDNEAFSDKLFKFIGPSLDGRAAQAKDARLDDELNRGGGRPVIYASLGTIFNTFMPFYQAVVAAFGDRDVTVVLSVGRNFDQMKLGRVPHNIFINQSVDQLAVLEKADLFITLYYKVPVVVVPMADDQPTVGARIAELGLGTVVRRKKINGQTLGRAASMILVDKQIADNVNSISEDMRKSGGNEQIVKDLDHILNQT